MKKSLNAIKSLPVLLILAAIVPITAAQSGSSPAVQFDLSLDERTASMIGQREMPVRETLYRGLRAGGR